MIYLDNAATSMIKPPEVYHAVEEAMYRCASIGRSGHTAARNAAETAFHCRTLAGQLFDIAPDRVVFTMNATHALNLAIFSLLNPNDRVVVSGFEHNAVMRPLQHLQADVCIAGRTLFDRHRMLRDFEQAISSDTKAVICTHVSNVFGNICPIEQIAAMCRKREIPFLIDASQSAGVLPVSVRQLGAAYVAMPGHKSLYGPQGTGLLLCGQTPSPLLYGGTGSLSRSLFMPDLLPDLAEAGTHNVPGIAGLAAGISYVMNRGTENIHAHEYALICQLREELRKIDGIRVFAADDEPQTGVLSFQADTMDCEILGELLSEQGFAVRAGLHCAPIAHESVGTIQPGTVRISVSAFNHSGEVELFISTLHCLLNK